ncbi:MAG: CPCC family cysteine-rich protein [Kofleriaceae bacterium]
MYPCPCCRYPTLDEPPPGTFAICPVCFWEDDNVQFLDPTYRGGANVESLTEARASFAVIGACDPRFAHCVRAPTLAELRGRSD